MLIAKVIPKAHRLREQRKEPYGENSSEGFAKTVSSGTCSTHFGFKWRDAGRAFSVLKLVKK